MIIFSLNIRGGGKRVKRKRIGFNIQRGRVDLAFIQETKLRNVQHQYVKELCGDEWVEWSHLEAEGAAGGILIMWKKDFFNLIYSFCGEGYLGVCVEKDNKRIYFINIYASWDHKVRMNSWRKLVELKRRSVVGSWCLGGDFKIVTSSEERVGISKKNYKREMDDFKEFIKEMELVDPPTIGGKFTWCNKCGSAMSRLDRFLLSSSFIDDWKALKLKISLWNKEVFGWIDLNIEEAEKEMHFLDNKFAHFAGNVLEEEVVKRSKAATVFWDNLYKKEGFLRLKSRQLWLAEDFTFNHFKSFFEDSEEGRPNLSGLDFKKLHVTEGLSLERPFTELEIKEAIWSCDGNKSAGPDGYSLDFFKRFWGVIRVDVLKMCNDFYLKGSLVKSITSSFLALIPKTNTPQSLGEFRTICLVGSIYKIIAKILASRLKEVIGNLVSTNLAAFVPGRNMMDGVLLVNEILDWSRRKKRSCLLLKVDFEKAYDSVSWQYLRETLMQMGFGSRWMRWMDACIFNNHMSVLVNGSATKEFKVQKGLRQGDPLSPFLFVLAMEGLTALVKKSVEVGNFKPFMYRENDSVDILQFADDTIILGEVSCDKIWNMKVILRGFELVSGLRINFSKSNIIGVNVGEWYMNAALTFLSCNKGVAPFRFLGIMVGDNPRRKKVWLEVVNNINRRLSSWKGRNITMGGRVTLINSVLNSIPIFTLSFFKIPGNIAKAIRKIQSEFLWSGKLEKRSIHWVKWEVVCRPMAKGGLGVRDVRYSCPKIRIQDYGGAFHRSDDSIWWKDMCKNNLLDDIIDNGFSGCFNCSCKNGMDVLFWLNRWLGEQPLCMEFPDLYELSNWKNCTVAEVLVWTRGSFRWDFGGLLSADSTHGYSNTTAAAASPNWPRFCDRIREFTPSENGCDTFSWSLDEDKDFTVASITHAIDSAKSFALDYHLINSLKVIWELKLPPKIKVFARRFFIDRLPTRDQLLKRVVANVSSPDCVMCGSFLESSSHLFFQLPRGENNLETRFYLTRNFGGD
ncbi:uncharacterized protein LOC131659337 [Vicia villosa]|uniref:uncharacterized protein LOC131659337 n=1 Tax=Vicia villosa TaxID=3911 RepID=UPI00273A77F7|nr:uncharacterized protein LOC131659337 [Vicia villosa]